MIEASFIMKRRDTEYQTQSFMVEKYQPKLKQEQKFIKMKARLIKAEN